MLGRPAATLSVLLLLGILFARLSFSSSYMLVLSHAPSNASWRPREAASRSRTLLSDVGFRGLTLWFGVVVALTVVVLVIGVVGVAVVGSIAFNRCQNFVRGHKDRCQQFWSGTTQIIRNLSRT